jgi:hypothetical protein
LRAAAAATKAGYDEGTKAGVDDEASAIRLGKIAGAQAVADVMAPILGLPADEVLKNNQDMLEKDIRRSMSATSGLPASPSELVTSSEKAASDAETKSLQNIAEKKKVMETTKKNAVKAVKDEIEKKLEAARESKGLSEGAEDVVSEEDQAQATIDGAEKAVREQLDVMEAEDGKNDDASSDSITGATGISQRRAEQVTTSIADEAVANVLRAENNRTTEEKSNDQEDASTLAERVDAAEADATELTEGQDEAAQQYEVKRAERQQEVDEAEARVEEAKKEKEVVEKTQRTEDATSEASLESSIAEVDTASPTSENTFRR